MRFSQTYIKVAGALLLLVSLVLPLSSCERYIDKQGNTIKSSEISTDGPLPPGMRVVKTFNYFYRTFQPTDFGSWLVLAGFIWPVFMIAALSRLKGRVRVACRFLEAPLLFGSVVALGFATLLHNRLEVGAYVAYTGIGAYSLGAVWADIDAFHQWKAAKATRTT
jgi:hypothetical protein